MIRLNGSFAASHLRKDPVFIEGTKPEKRIILFSYSYFLNALVGPDVRGLGISPSQKGICGSPVKTRGGIFKQLSDHMVP